MAGIAEVLVGGGVAAILGAIIGGGLRAFGVDVPLVASRTRQAALFGVGALLIGGGAWYGRPTPPPGCKPVEAGEMAIVDFRPSHPFGATTAAEGSGYLMVTAHIDVWSVAGSDCNPMWTGTTALLHLDGATIPFKANYFTNLGNSEKEDEWFGTETSTAGPVALADGKPQKSDVMFWPLNTGSGRYRWDDFLRAIAKPDVPNPTLEVTIATTARGREERPILQRCVVRLDEQAAAISQVAAGQSVYWITADCREGSN